jgi:hypothetical protein
MVLRDQGVSTVIFADGFLLCEEADFLCYAPAQLSNGVPHLELTLFPCGGSFICEEADFLCYAPAQLSK